MKQGQVITITIQADNAAFEDNPGGEVARILCRVAAEFEWGQERPTIKDANGNTVGRVEIVDGERF